VSNEAPALRGIHLDLKYHMPRKDYLLDWLRRLPGWGINAVLVEYEDKFPYAKYPFVRDPDAFTPEELRRFLDTAHEAGLTVIPLVQTFAHLEFCLAHDELTHLRETPDIRPKICANNPEAVEFVKDLLGEVLAYHTEDPYFHLGGDEVWHTTWCERCQARIDEVGPIRFWCDHERKLIEVLHAAGKRPIAWDDIFWKEPEAVADSGLPKDLVLHAWNYNITELGGAGDSNDVELGGAGGVLGQVDAYRRAGYDSVAAPCFNAGQLFPRHTHVLRNTRAWARKIRSAGMLGMLNTAWAVFHVPLGVTNLHVAATGALCADADADVESAAWQRAWLEAEYGGSAEGAPEALEALGRNVSVPLPDYGRSFTAALYAYTNMVLHYPGRQKDRRTIGPYPLDWNEVDFTALYLKGIAEGRKSEKLPKVLAGLDDLLRALVPAVEALERFADGATRRREEADDLAVLARLKLANARVLKFFLSGEGDRAALRAEFEAQRPAVARAMSRAWEPVGAERMMRVYWRALYDALET